MGELEVCRTPIWNTGLNAYRLNYLLFSTTYKFELPGKIFNLCAFHQTYLWHIHDEIGVKQFAFHWRLQVHELKRMFWPNVLTECFSHHHSEIYEDKIFSGSSAGSYIERRFTVDTRKLTFWLNALFSGGRYQCMCTFILKISNRLL